MLSILGKTILYIGGLFFVILVAFILYKFDNLIVFLPILIASGACNFMWWRVILDSRKYPEESFHIKQTEDRGTPYITYMASYTSVLPLIAGGIYGLIAFFIILFTFYFIYINSDIIYYNPFLAMAGYKYFKVTTSYGDEVYLISKDVVKSGQEVNSYKITDYTYLVS